MCVCVCVCVRVHVCAFLASCCHKPIKMDFFTHKSYFAFFPSFFLGGGTNQEATIHKNWNWKDSGKNLELELELESFQ